MLKKLSPLLLCSGVVGLSLLFAANPAIAKNDKNANNNKPATTVTPPPPVLTTPDATTTVAGPTQSATPATSSFAVGLTDLGKIFRINFDGNVETQTVSGLTSFADLTFKGFTTQNGNTIAQFDVLLDNTSSGNITSRVSGFGFNTNQTLLSSTSASGVFDSAHLGDSFPNQFGNIDVCFNTGNTCQGGTNGGVNNNTSLPGTFDVGKFSFSLALAGNVNSLTLSNFGVRYQSIGGTSLGTSGTGKAVSITPVTSTPPKDPTPPAEPTPPKEPTPPSQPTPPTEPTQPSQPTPPKEQTPPPVPNPPLFDKPIDGTPSDPTPPTPPTDSTPSKPSTPKPKKVPEPGTVAALALVSAIAARYRKQQQTEI